jgi:hypothetical protein
LVLPLLKVAINQEEKEESTKDKGTCYDVLGNTEAFFGFVVKVLSYHILLVPFSESNPVITGTQWAFIEDHVVLAHYL